MGDPTVRRPPWAKGTGRKADREKVPTEAHAALAERSAEPLEGLDPEAQLALAQAVAIALLHKADKEVEARAHERLATEAKVKAQLRAHLEQAAQEAGLAATRAWKQSLSALKSRLGRPPDPARWGDGQGLTVVEITARIRLGQFLLRPGAELNSLAAGVIGRAQHFTGVHIGSVHVLSGHMGLVVAVHSPDQLADFTNRVFGQLGSGLQKVAASLRDPA